MVQDATVAQIIVIYVQQKINATLLAKTDMDYQVNKVLKNYALAVEVNVQHAQ